MLGRHVQAAEGARTLAMQDVTPPPIGHCTRRHNLRRFAAAKVKDQPGGDFEPVADKSRIEPAFEAIAGVARDVELAAGRRSAHRVE